MIVVGLGEWRLLLSGELLLLYLSGVEFVVRDDGGAVSVFFTVGCILCLVLFVFELDDDKSMSEFVVDGASREHFAKSLRSTLP